MSTPEQPAAPSLTRKQMREIRNTGATPIISGDSSRPDSAPAETPTAAETSEPAASTAESAAASPETTEAAPFAPARASAFAPPVRTAAPLPRAAMPPAVGDAPIADASVDLGVTPLTRRQARQQERIRTASVPVITPEVIAAHAERAEASPVIIDTVPESDAVFRPSAQPVIEAELVEAELVEAELVEAEPAVAEPVDAASTDAADDTHAVGADAAASAESTEDRAVVSPQLGADFLAGEPIEVALPPSFDQLISRSVTGAVMTGNALILSQTPSAPPLSAPVTATGEVLITGSFHLPEGLGSTGHAVGTADGKEADAVLVDGELPAHSSPTPIAASAAISTVKTSGDVITPPTPEKGGRLMLALAITAGVLALAIVGLLIFVVATGALS